jgi:lathosterol oxidase
MIVQYLLFTGLIYLVFYVWKNKALWSAKIQQRYPKNKHIFREIRYSAYSLLILGVIIAFVVWANKHHLTQAYKPIDKYGWGYYALSLVIMIVIHDTYFYWGHRFLHWKPIFKYVHKTHHLSINPTPFAAYAFHPLEAIFEMGIVPVLVFTVPHHISAISVFAMYSLLLNIAAHVGYEFLPKGFARHKILKWHNTATHHNMHHTNFKTNFGLYFNFWDTLMKTNHPHYEEFFEELADRRKQAPAKNTENLAEVQTVSEINTHESVSV